MDINATLFSIFGTFAYGSLWYVRQSTLHVVLLEGNFKTSWQRSSGEGAAAAQRALETRTGQVMMNADAVLLEVALTGGVPSAPQPPPHRPRSRDRLPRPRRFSAAAPASPGWWWVPPAPIWQDSAEKGGKVHQRKSTPKGQARAGVMKDGEIDGEVASADIRLLRSRRGDVVPARRITVLREELARAKRRRAVPQRGRGRRNARYGGFSRGRLERKLQGSVASTAKLKQAVKDQTLRAENAEREIVSLRRELKDAQRDAKRKDQAGSSSNVRLNRALEQVETLRAQLKESRAGGREELDASRKQMERMAAEMRRLERQRNELLTAFRKQLKLVDVLKRQKLHIEAAKMLSFTEDEFAKTLEMSAP